MALFCFIRSVSFVVFTQWICLRDGFVYTTDLFIGWISHGFVYAMDFTWVFSWDVRFVSLRFTVFPCGCALCLPAFMKALSYRVVLVPGGTIHLLA